MDEKENTSLDPITDTQHYSLEESKTTVFLCISKISSNMKNVTSVFLYRVYITNYYVRKRNIQNNI